MYIEREIKERFVKVSELYNIVAVVGPRQSGKTTFLKERIKGLKSSYVMFDDPDIRALFEDIKKFEIQVIEGNETVVLDEIQYGKDAGIKLKYLSEKGRRVWITSSSEILLGKDILSYLVGRVSIIRLYPFSLREFLEAKKQKEMAPNTLERMIWEHMMFGAYPKVVLAEDIEAKKIILRDLYDTMILKDVARAFSINDINVLEEIAKYLAIVIGNQLSFETLSKRMNISFQTVKKIIDAMEKSYIILRIAPFSTNKLKEITKQPKIYFIDTGLRNVVAKSFDSQPSGNLFENYVLSELIKAGFAPKYWRTKTGAEVDFIVEKDNEIIPIEAKLDAGDKIERSMRSFIDMYKPKRAFIVSYKSKEKELHVNGCRVIVTNILKLRELL